MIYQNSDCIDKKPNKAFYPAKITGNEQLPNPDDRRGSHGEYDSEDEYDSDGDYRGRHHGPLLLTAEALRDGTAWKGTSPGPLAAVTSSIIDNSCKRRKADPGSAVPMIIVTSPDGLVSPCNWNSPGCMVRLQTPSVNTQLLHVEWKPSRVEEPACRSSLQPEQGQYTLATIDDGIARLVMKKKGVNVKDKNVDYKLSAYEDDDFWDD